MSLNKVLLIGQVGRNPEIRYTPTGLPVVNFSVATEEAYLDKEGRRQERTDCHRVVVVGKLALTCNEHLKKEWQVFVGGSLRTRKWESNRVNGRHTEIAATWVQFLGARPTDAKV
jgi:single-strand DNA-binding protein